MDTSSNVSHHLAKIVATLPFPAFWTNLEAKVLGANQAYIEATGSQHRDKVVGKNPHDYLPTELAEQTVAQLELVRKVNEAQSYEETLIDKISGRPRYFTTFRNPITDDHGYVVAIFSASFETTAEKEKLGELGRAIAHDISSPLASLKVLLTICTELPANKRALLNEAVSRASEIITTLSTLYKKEEQQSAAGGDREQLLVSDHLVQLVNDRKNQFKNFPVTFETEISNEAHFAFAQIGATQFSRVVMNLINNAIDSLNHKSNNGITILLDADQETITLTIKDTCSGMSPVQVRKFMNREKFEDNIESIGYMRMMQVWNILDQNCITLNMDSTINKGTEIRLSIPRISASTWIAKGIAIHPESLIIILDDDDSMQSAWNVRFKPYLKRFPSMSLRHFTQGRDMLNYLETIRPSDRERILFLCDYELMNQSRNGLQILEESQLENAVLVTGYYSNRDIQETAARLGVKIIPKPMTALVQIYCRQKDSGKRE